MATEVATAYVSLVPSAKGFGAAAAAQMGPQMGPAGASAGTAASGAFGGALTKGVVAGSAIAATAGVAAFAAAFSIGDSFDQAFDTIRVGTGATGDALEGLKDDFRDVVTTVPTDFESASTAIADLNTRLGLTGQPLSDLSAQILELSRLTNTDVGTNIEQVTRVMGDWGVSTEDTAAQLDLLFRASQATGPSVDSLGRLMVQYGAPMRQLGFTFEESAALLGSFEREGVNTELVMGSLRIALGQMARDGEPAQETLARVVDQIKNAGDVSEANALALELFGSRAGPDMAAAIREGRFEVDELTAAIAGGEETILSAAEDTESFGEKWTVLKNRVLVGLEPIATKLFEAMGDGMDWLSEEVIPDLKAGFEVLSLWWTTNGPGITATAQQVLGTLRTGFETVVTTAVAVSDAFTQRIMPAVSEVSSTVVPIVRDVASSITAAFGNVRAWVDENWPRIQATITTVMDAIKTVVDATLGVVRFVWDSVGQDILDIVDASWVWVKETIGGAMQFIQGIIETVMAVVTGDWSGAWEGIKTALGGVWDSMKATVDLGLVTIGNILQGAWSLISDTLGGAFGAARDRASEAIEAVVGFVTGLPGRIGGIGTSIAEAIIGGLKSAWNAAASTINDLIPDSIGVGIGPSIDVEDNPLPIFHDGGIVPGQPGQEVLAVLEAGERVYSASATAAAGGDPMGGGGPLEVVVVMPNGEVLARASAPHLRAQRRAYA